MDYIWTEYLLTELPPLDFGEGLTVHSNVGLSHCIKILFMSDSTVLPNKVFYCVM